MLIDIILLFLFYLNIFNVSNTLLKVIRALIKPEKLTIGKLELLFFWISLSYILTFIEFT